MYIVADIFSIGIWEDFKDVQNPHLKELSRKIPGLMLQSRQEGTVKNYVYGFNRWKKWAAQFPEVDSLPAKPKYLAMFMTEILYSSKSHAPVSNIFYSLSWAHKMAGIADPTEHEVVKRIKDSAHRMLGNGNNKKAPVTPDILFSLYDFYGDESATLKDLRIMTICLLSYSGFLRYDEYSNVLFSDVVFYDNFLTLFIEKSKTDIHRDGRQVYISATSSKCCTFKMLKRYIVAAKFAPDSQDFLFKGLTYHHKSKTYTLRKQHKGLSYTTAREIVLKAFASVGLNIKDFGTHSMRKGGATSAAKNHVLDRLILKHGRWESEKSKDLYISEGVSEKLSVSRNLGI